MNIKDYISSGILEMYVLGQCTPAECTEVELYALEYPEIKAEIEALREALNQYVLQDEKIPPAYLKEKIAAALSAISSGQSGTKVVYPGKETSSLPKERLYLWITAACIGLLITSIFINYRFYTGMQETRKEIATLHLKNDSLAGTLQEQKENFARTQKQLTTWQSDMALLKKPNMITMELGGTKFSPGSKAMVYVDTKTNDIYLEVEKLPKAPEGMQYQFWAIVKGKPVDAGMIDLCEQPDVCGIHKMSIVPGARAFAISLEKKGGSTEGPKGEIYAAYGI